MEIFANELSFTKDSLMEYENVHMLARVSGELKEYGVSTCRISCKEYAKVVDVIRENDSTKNLLNFAFSFFTAPFEGNELIESVSEEYLSHVWTCRSEDCEGLVFAYLTDALALSVDHRVWGEIVKVKRDEVELDVRNVASDLHLAFHSEWLDSKKPAELVISDVSPMKKTVHLRDDHGKDKLLIFSKKLVRSPYVEGIINSLPFNADSRSFVRSISEDGIVECVLYWYDEGYGLAVKTTGRNRRETAAIAEILERDFGRGRRKS